MEDSLFKRPWFGTQGVFHRDGWTYEERAREAYARWFAELVESHASREVNCTTPTVLARALPSTATAIREAVLPAQAPESELPDLLRRESVPFLAALRFTDSGLAKHTVWQETWTLQRREDAGENVGTVQVPPKYDQKDFRDASCWRLRGKLDVPKERFISYPGCESDEDREPVYGWAGWNHLQRAQALAALYQDRKQREGWSKDRLTPMLAGLLELIPWIKQWHNEPSEEFECLRLGDYFQSYLEGECRELGLTVEELRAWRPERKAKARATKKAKTAEVEGG